MGKFIGKDITGQRFGTLTALYPTDKRAKGGYVVWVCECDCGNRCERTLKQLRHKSHGTESHKACSDCMRKYNSELHRTHGGTHTRLFGVYRTMLGRCTNPNAHEYENYGGRGITVCEEWKDYEAFRDWALANGYDETAKRGACTLDRIDTNKGYSPENCRFVDMKTQQRNRRNTVFITYKGERKSMSEWAEIVKTNYGTLRKRYEYGWSTEQILFGK